MKGEISGHIVNYPTEFLREERLNQRFLYKEVFIPEITFV